MTLSRVTPKVAKSVIIFSLAILFVATSGWESWGQTADATKMGAQAQALWNSRRWDEAVLAFEAYLRNYPDGALAPQAYLHLGKYLEGHKRLPEARHYYEMGLKKAKGQIYQVLQTEIADVEMKFGNHDKVVRIYQEILNRPASWSLFKIANKKLLSMHFLKARREQGGHAANSCGEESLKTVLKQLDIAPRTEIFQKLAKEPENQTSLAALKQAALAHGVKGYGLKVEDGRLARVPAPAILLCHPAHYLVFHGLSRAGVKISDPSAISQEDKVVPLAELKEKWTGYALCFQVKKGEVSKGLTFLDDQEMKRLRGGFDQPGDSFTSNRGSDVPYTEMIDPPNILVNSFSLNLVIEEVDAAWKAMVNNIVLKRTYNSEDPGSGMFGHSWHFQYEIFLKEDPSGNVTLTRGSGRVDNFTKRGDGTYAPPKAVFDKLVKNVNGTFTLLEKNTKSTYYFGTNLYLTKMVDKNGNALDFSWGANGLTGITIHYYGTYLKKILFEYGTAGKCTKATLPDGRFATFTYAADGTLLTSTDLAGYQTSYSYDANKYITAITTPYGRTNILYQHSPGNYNIYAPQKVTDPLGNVSQFTVSGIDIVYTDANGNQTKYSADGPTGFTGKIVAADGGVTSFTYDGYGNRTSVTDPSGAKWQMAYTSPATGNLTQITDPLGKAVVMAYSAADDLVTVNAPLGRRSSFQYDAKHNLLKATDALNRAATFTYSAQGNLTKVLLPGNPIPQLSFAYNVFGQLIAETDPAGKITRYRYDAAGRLASRTDAKGAVVGYAYDKLDRLITATYADGKVAYTYDSTVLRSVTAKDGRKMGFLYDKDARLVSFTDLNGFNILYGYNKMGNLTSLTYPGGKVVKYGYDKNNRLSRVTDWLQHTTAYAYSLAGEVTQVTYPNGTGTRLFYDQNHRLLVHQNDGLPGKALPQFAYLLDDLGNRIGETRRNINFNGPSWKNVAASYDPADRILNAGSAWFLHDANGNLVRKTLGSSIWNYTYDYNNMLTRFQTPAATYQYEYDPLLNRVSSQVGAIKKLSVVDPNHPLARVLMQTNASKVPTDYYVYGLGLISRINSTGNAFYYHYDGLGSTVAVTNAAGTVVNRYAYDPFGNLLTKQEIFANPFRYVGRFEVMDEGNGLYYMRARYYDPDNGRFISKDPIGLKDGINKYTYVKNNPTSYLDPTGRSGGKYGKYDESKYTEFPSWVYDPAFNSFYPYSPPSMGYKYVGPPKLSMADQLREVRDFFFFISNFIPLKWFIDIPINIIEETIHAEPAY